MDNTITELMAALRQLENTSSITAKKQLLEKYGRELPQFKVMLDYALDPYKKFHLKQVPAGPTMGGESTWDDLKTFWNKANAETLKGTQLIGEYNSIAGRLNSDGKELFRRVTLKDLRCGVGPTLVNSVFQNLIPTFGVMLAEPLKERHVDYLSTYGAFVYAQPKMNGDRCVVICEEGKETQVLSRKGHPMHNYNGVAAALTLVQRNSRYKSLVFDGEVICGDFFKTRSVKKLKGNEAKDAVFYCFDTIHGDQWKRGFTDQFRQRNQITLELAAETAWQHSPNLVVVPTWKLRDNQINWAFLLRLRDWCIRRGFEGVMIRPNLPYNFDTRSSLYKLKKMDTMDCMIMEVLLGEEGKKHANHAGAVLVQLDDGETLCKAGLKLSDAERDEMWENRAQYVGKVAEIQYQELTRNQDNVPKLQFPVYIRLREDKS